MDKISMNIPKAGFPPFQIVYEQIVEKKTKKKEKQEFASKLITNIVSVEEILKERRHNEPQVSVDENK